MLSMQNKNVVNGFLLRLMSGSLGMTLTGLSLTLCLKKNSFY